MGEESGEELGELLLTFFSKYQTLTRALWCAFGAIIIVFLTSLQFAKISIRRILNPPIQPSYFDRRLQPRGLQIPGFWSSRPDLFVKLFTGMFLGSRNSMMRVKYSIYIAWHRHSRSLPLYITEKPLHDLYFQGHGVASQHLFIDFPTPWPKRIDINTKITLLASF